MRLTSLISADQYVHFYIFQIKTEQQPLTVASSQVKFIKK